MYFVYFDMFILKINYIDITVKTDRKLVAHFIPHMYQKCQIDIAKFLYTTNGIHLRCPVNK